MSMCRVGAPPLSSPLFPYTTLFRSERLGRPQGSAGDLDQPLKAGIPLSSMSALGQKPTFLSVNSMSALPPKADICSALADRKSTRLNSSHLGISYAVFCLKKNKKKT